MLQAKPCRRFNGADPSPSGECPDLKSGEPSTPPSSHPTKLSTSTLRAPSMDPQSIASALAATLSPDNAVNKPATDRLKASEAAPGFAVSLLRVTEASSIDLVTRQAASTYFKNFVKRQWVRVLSCVLFWVPRAHFFTIRRPHLTRLPSPSTG